MQIIEKTETSIGTKISIYFRPGRTGGMFVVFVGNIQRCAKPTLKGARGVVAKIVRG
jgi:hypothetical protein